MVSTGGATFGNFYLRMNAFFAKEPVEQDRDWLLQCKDAEGCVADDLRSLALEEEAEADCIILGRIAN